MALPPLQALVDDLLGTDLPVAIRAFDGTSVGPSDATATIVIRNREAIARLLLAPGELGFARAYVAGDLDLEGDIWEVLELRHRLGDLRLRRRHLALLAEAVGLRHLRPLPPPEQEARLRGRRHSRARDAAAISHHYDVSNRFYELVLGPSLTYSCAVFEHEDDSLEQAQANKYELICRKLGLQAGQRLLDVGCGWGGMLLHAARHHGVTGVGITLSRAQAELAEKRVAEAGLASRIQVRLCDYRELDDGPYDAISSIGMFEHVGLSQLSEYFTRLLGLLGPGGRLLNHGIARPGGAGGGRARLHRRGFIDRYVFPDGELHEVGRVVSSMQDVGFEVRHLENLREHYAITLRRWVANLERHWEDAVAEVGEGRARVWRLYMAACSVSFQDGANQIHQVLAARPDTDGRSGLGLRPDWTGPLATRAPVRR